MRTANDLVDEIPMASNEHGQATTDGNAGGRRTSSPTNRTPTPQRGRGLSVSQAIALAVGLLVVSAIAANAARSNDGASNDAVPTTALSTTLVEIRPTIVTTAPLSAVAATATTSATLVSASTTGITPTTPATVVATAAGATTVSTAPGPTTAGPATPTTAVPAVIENPPGPLLPTGQPWPEAILENSRLVARGAVPSAAVQDAVVAMLGQLVGGDKVTSELVVDAKAARVLYVPVRLSAPLQFAASDGELIEAEKSVLVLWGTFLRDHATAEVLVVARGPKPLPPDQVTVASARAVAAGRAMIGSGATAKQIKSLIVGDATVQTGRLEISIKVPA